MKIKDNIIVFSGLILLANLILSAVFNLVLSNPGRIYSNFIEPIFFIVATLILVREWKIKGLISILIIYMLPFAMLIIISLLEHGISMVYKVITKPVIYKSRLYSLIGIIIGYVIVLIEKQIKIMKSKKMNVS